ncbi:MAG: DUF6903 family protein [Lachnospiraceae bacterium]
MNYWKEHVKLRVLLIAVFCVLGIAMVVGGWKMTGQLAGLGIMVVGVSFLLVSLFLYNKPFQTPSRG